MNNPQRVLSLGAGVQSTTLLLMILEGELEPVDHIIFADTGYEPEPVYQHLAYLKTLIDAAGIPFHLVSNGNIREETLDPTKRAASMPFFTMNQDGSKGMVRRQCTAEYKLKPLLAKQRELAGLKKGERCKEHRITTVIGISWDESQRMRDPAFSWLRNEYPLIDLRMTRQDCITWCESKQYPKPPRSACIACPFKSDDEWRRLRDTMPNEWEDAVQFDHQLRIATQQQGAIHSTPFLHRSCVPLDEVDLRTNQERGIMTLFEEFEQECEGMCGL
jgi:hypothetical protein